MIPHGAAQAGTVFHGAYHPPYAPGANGDGDGKVDGDGNNDDSKNDGIQLNNELLNGIFDDLGALQSSYNNGMDNMGVSNICANRRAPLNRGFNLNTANIGLRSGGGSRMDQIYQRLNGGIKANPLAEAPEKVLAHAKNALQLNKLKDKIQAYSVNGGDSSIINSLKDEIRNLESRLNENHGFFNNNYGPRRGLGNNQDYGDNSSMLYISLFSFFSHSVKFFTISVNNEQKLLISFFFSFLSFFFFYSFSFFLVCVFFLSVCVSFGFGDLIIFVCSHAYNINITIILTIWHLTINHTYLKYKLTHTIWYFTIDNIY